MLVSGEYGPARQMKAPTHIKSSCVLSLVLERLGWTRLSLDFVGLVTYCILSSVV